MRVIGEPGLPLVRMARLRCARLSELAGVSPTSVGSGSYITSTTMHWWASAISVRSVCTSAAAKPPSGCAAIRVAGSREPGWLMSR